MLKSYLVGGLKLGISSLSPPPKALLLKSDLSLILKAVSEWS